MIKYLRWTSLFPILFVIGLLARGLSPFACLFIVTEPRLDVVKRLGKKKVLLPRDSLVWWLTWFDTDDNATDEYWYGMYGLTKYWTQAQYDNSAILRWFMRVLWLQRNSAYTFNRKFFGIARDSKWAWQYKAQWPLAFGYYNDINIGYKAHRGFDKLMFAGRILGIRKYKDKD